MKTKTVLFVLFIASALAFTLAPNWNVDAAHSKISFHVKGPFGNVNGSFTGLKATVFFDPGNLATSKIMASVDVSTIETGIGLRNKDLREKEEWFNVSKFPQITIKSKQVEKVGEGYKLTADLTMKGVTKQVDIPFTFLPNATGGVLKARFIINREDFGVGQSGGTVSKDVTINLEVPVTK